MKDNLFIVFEHIDGAGGSSQVKRLDDWLWSNTSYDVQTGSEPTNLKTGVFIRKVLKKEYSIKNNDVITGLFIADRCLHNNQIENFFKEKNKIYICDRYYYSNMVYNSILFDDMERIENMNSMFRKPDICFYIDVSPEVAMSRIEKRGDEKELFESLGYLRTVKEKYDRLCSKGKMIRIDGNQPEEKVFEDILNYLKNVIDINQ